MKEKLFKIWNSIWESNPNQSSTNPIKSFIRLAYASFKRFGKDEDLIRASSISYAIIVSFIPTLILSLLLAANFINIKDYEELAKEYIRKHGIPMDVSAYFKIIYELLNNTAALTGIGFLFVLFSTTSVLRNLEDAVNKIWQVKRKRPFIQRVAEFVMVVLFGPLLLTIGLSLGQSLLNEFSAPSLLKFYVGEKTEYIVGDKHVLLRKSKDNTWIYSNILDKIDYDFQKDPVIFEPDTNRVLNEQETIPLLHKVKRVSKQSLRTAAFMDVAVFDKNIYIITDIGAIIFSKDGGKFWQARNYQRKQLNILLKTKFHRIKMFNNLEGVILGKSGLILRTEDGGENWIPAHLPDLKEDLYNISEISPGEYLVIGESFTAISTRDNGRSWNPYIPLTKLNTIDKENLNGIASFDNSTFICGDAGTIITTKDNGKTWFKKSIGFKKIDFSDIAFINEKRGAMVGTDGNIRYTLDGGVIWKKAKSPTSQNLLSIHFSNKENRFVILGENYHILTNTNENINEYMIEEKSPFWRIAITALGKFFLPFAVLWVTFFLVYSILPYTDVEFKPAAIGAIATSLALVLFIIGFQYYIAFFSAAKFAIYGTLAAIPLALLLIYVSTIIILFGCEITYLIQHPELIHQAYSQEERFEFEKYQIWNGIQILHKIHTNFKQGLGETKERDLAKFCNSSEMEFERFINIFIDNKFIAKTENGGYAPLLAPELIDLDSTLELLSPVGYGIQKSDHSTLPELVDLLGKYKNSRQEIFSKKTLANLL
jgi:uncharacterized BrkB/YihY/UPF0761 family membrane protein/photosystem II stability/assembly factor-like uncharacterized protein